VRDDSGAVGQDTSSFKEPFSFYVSEVNDAPAFVTTSYTLGTVDAGVDSASNIGIAINAVIAPADISDPDVLSQGIYGTKFDGIAIVGTTATDPANHGQWQFWDGSSWTGITAADLTASNALVLSATTKIRFVPAGSSEVTTPPP
jgi:tetrahydromethanopterin S-methyltransferase subunit H